MSQSMAFLAQTARSTGLTELAQQRWRAFRRKHFRTLLNFYPPYVGAGVRLDHVAEDFTAIEVSMRLTWYNKNYVGTHFGGSLYSMCDPWYMLILVENLGPDYVVWDKAGSVHYRRPGRGRVSARFELSPAEIATIRDEVDAHGKLDRLFRARIRDEQGKTVAEVEKTVSIRKKAAT
jgi:acyl-coenzyme A thioesterase PaaI-like protein